MSDQNEEQLSPQEQEPQVEEQVLEEETFDPSIKKKKKNKKKAVIEADEPEDGDDAPTQAWESESTKEQPEEEDALDFSDMKKKKKKKKEKAFEDEEQVEPEETPDFSDLKKKKKKKSVKIVDEDEAAVDETHENEEDESLPQDGDNEIGFEDSTASDVWNQTCTRDFTYSELLSRVFNILHANNPELAGEKRRYTIVPPQVARDGNKKSVFVNIVDICKRMNRTPEHVIQFLFAELGTNGSVDGSQRLVIKGRFQQKQIENVLRRYIVEYVTCKTCKSPDTVLRKENRLYFMQCESCGSSRSVIAIKAGFQVQTSRKAARAKAV